MMELLADPNVWLSFVTLTVLEIVLGIDNIIFLSILVSRLPPAQQHRGRVLGLGFAIPLSLLVAFFRETYIDRMGVFLCVLAMSVSTSFEYARSDSSRSCRWRTLSPAAAAAQAEK